MLYIIKEDNFMADYILDAIDGRDDIAMITFERTKYRGLKKICQTVIRFLRSIVINKRGLWNTWFFPDSFTRQLDVIRVDDKVLLFSCQNLKELLVLDKEIASHSKSVFLWNPLSSINHNAYSRWEYAWKLHRTDMRICTFDEGDARDYGFEYVNQVYRMPDDNLRSVVTETSSDVFFVGKDKKRSKVLAELVSELNRQNIKLDFCILRDKYTKVLSVLQPYYTDELVRYADYRAKAMRSKCMLEILQNGQTGMTLRTIEALFFNKKLITNNAEIRNSPIYHPNNIYILDGTENRTIREFIDNEPYKFPQNIITKYDIRQWIKTFL